MSGSFVATALCSQSTHSAHTLSWLLRTQARGSKDTDTNERKQPKKENTCVVTICSSKHQTLFFFSDHLTHHSLGCELLRPYFHLQCLLLFCQGCWTTRLSCRYTVFRNGVVVRLWSWGAVGLHTRDSNDILNVIHQATFYGSQCDSINSSFCLDCCHHRQRPFHNSSVVALRFLRFGSRNFNEEPTIYVDQYKLQCTK